MRTGEKETKKSGGEEKRNGRTKPDVVQEGGAQALQKGKSHGGVVLVNMAVQRQVEALTRKPPSNREVESKGTHLLSNAVSKVNRMNKISTHTTTRAPAFRWRRIPFRYRTGKCLREYYRKSYYKYRCQNLEVVKCAVFCSIFLRRNVGLIYHMRALHRGVVHDDTFGLVRAARKP